MDGVPCGMFDRQGVPVGTLDVETARDVPCTGFCDWSNCKALRKELFGRSGPPLALLIPPEPTILDKAVKGVGVPRDRPVGIRVIPH